MIVVTGGRQSGKTEAICRWLRENPEPRAVIVANGARVRYILDRLVGGPTLHRYPWKGHVLCATDFQSGGFSLFRLGFPEVCIDDLEDVFKAVFGSSLEFVTMTATWIPLSPTGPIKVDAQAGEVVKEILAVDTFDPGHIYPKDNGPHIPGRGGW